MSVYIYGNGSDPNDTIALILNGVSDFRVNDTRALTTKKIQSGSIIADHVSKSPTEITVAFTVGDVSVSPYSSTRFPIQDKKSWLSTQLAGVAVDVGKTAIQKSLKKILKPESITQLKNGFTIANGIYDMSIEQFQYFNFIDPESNVDMQFDDKMDISEYCKTMRELILKIEDVGRKDFLYTLQSRRLGVYDQMILKSITISELKGSVGGFECTMNFSKVYIGMVQESSLLSSIPNGVDGVSGMPTGKAGGVTNSTTNKVGVNDVCKKQKTHFEGIANWNKQCEYLKLDGVAGAGLFFPKVGGK